MGAADALAVDIDPDAARIAALEERLENADMEIAQQKEQLENANVKIAQNEEQMFTAYGAIADMFEIFLNT